jgi:hypothetical protein
VKIFSCARVLRAARIPPVLLDGRHTHPKYRGLWRRWLKSRVLRAPHIAQVLLDGFARFDLPDCRGNTALEHARASPAWPALAAAFAACAPGGGAVCLLAGDRVRAVYLGERGTRFEHQNLWRLVSRFSVRCAEGLPRLAGSRAFRRSESRYGGQEVDHRDLGQLRVGDAGELSRAGSAVYVLALEFEDPATRAPREAQAHLCGWRGEPRTFETKFNAVAVGLREGEEHELRVLSVDESEWPASAKGAPP